MDALTKILGGQTRVRLLRLFIFNPNELYSKESIAKRVRASLPNVTRELGVLLRAGLIKKKAAVFEHKRNGKIVKQKGQGFQVVQDAFLYVPLREFLLETLSISPDELLRLMRTAGRPRLVVASGFFVHNWEQQLDLFVVGDRMDEEKLAHAISQYEIEVGRELSYTCLSTEDFYYRSSIQDRLIRDVFDYPHQVLFDRIDIV